MAGAFTPYSNFVLGLHQAQFNFSTDTFVCTLHAATYTPNVQTDFLWSAISVTELPTTNGYTAGGILLPSQSLSLVNGLVVFKSSDIVWAAPFTAGPFRWAVFVKRAGSTLVPSDRLVCFNDLGGGATLTGGGGSFTIQIPSSTGFFQSSHTP